MDTNLPARRISSAARTVVPSVALTTGYEHTFVPPPGATMYPIDFDDPNYLEPAHSHNPSQISHLTTLPSSVAQASSTSFQQVLAAAQESTSVAYASFQRLQEIVRERFHRLVPARDQHGSDAGRESWLKC